MALKAGYLFTKKKNSDAGYGVEEQETQLDFLSSLAGVYGKSKEVRDILKPPEKSFVGKVFDVLNSGAQLTGGIITAIKEDKPFGESIKKAFREDIMPGEALGIARKHTNWKEAIKDPRTYGALAADILLDPVTYLTFGYGAGAKLGGAAGKIAPELTGKILNGAGKSLFKQYADVGVSRMISQGVEREMAMKIAETSATKGIARRILMDGGERLIDKGGLKFFGQEILPRIAITKPLGAIGRGIKAIPVVGEGAEALQKGLSTAFKPFAGISEKVFNIGGRKTAGQDYVDNYLFDYSKKVRAEIQAMGDFTLGLRKEAEKKAKSLGKTMKELNEEFGRLYEGGEAFASDAGLNDILLSLKKSADMRTKELLDKGVLTSAEFNHLRHYLTKEGMEYLRKGGDVTEIYVRPLKSGYVAGKQAELSRKFIDLESGETFVGRADVLGLQPVNILKGLGDDLTVGEVRTFEDIKNALGKYGYELEFKPQARVHRTAGGYFDSRTKKLVIAAQQPTPQDVLDIVKHELTHGSQFQMAGSLDMIETLTAKGKKYAGAKAVLDTAKASAMEEWPKILKAIGVDFDTLSSAKKIYYRKPTELLAYAASELAKNSDSAKLFPKTAEAINALKKESPLFDLLDKNIDENLAMVAKGTFVKKTAEGERFFTSSRASIQEINDLMRPKLEALGYKKTEFFDPNFWAAYARGEAEAIKALRTNSWLTQVASNFGQTGEIIKDISKSAAGKTIFTEKLKDKVVDGVRYTESRVEQLKGVLLPEPIVKHIEQTYEFLTTDKSLKEFLNIYDKALNFWKGSVTSWFPAFHSRNFLGGVFNNWLAGVKNPLRYIQGDAIARNKAGKIVTELGKEYDYTEIRAMVSRLGITGQPGILDVIAEPMDNIIKAGGGFLRDAMNYPKAIMGTVEDRLRIPLFVDRLIKGDEPIEAAKKVFQFHFDYAPEGLTAFERNVMRRLIPFYRWSRGNIPLQITQIAKQPGKVASMGKLLNQFQDTDKMREEMEFLPDYIRENLPIRIGEKESVAQYLYGLGLPIEDINKLWRGDFKRTMEGLLSELNPGLKWPIEAATGTNLYFGTKIDDFYRAPDFVKSLPQPIKEWMDVHQLKNGSIVADPDKLHLLQSLFSRGWITMDKMTNPKTDWAVKVLYGVVGMKARAINIEQQKYFTNRDRISALEDYLVKIGEGKQFSKFYIPKD